MKWYALDENSEPVEIDILSSSYSSYKESQEKHTIQDENIGDCEIVSTTFLGLDHSYGVGDPVLFETMVFGGKLDQEQVRYTSWEDAKKGHKKMLEKVRATEKGVDGSPEESV